MLRSLVSVCVLFALAIPVAAEPLLSASQRLDGLIHAQAPAPGSDAARQSVVADLARLDQAALSLRDFLSSGPPRYSPAELQVQKDGLELARSAFHLDAGVLGPDPVLASIDQLAQQLHQRLSERQDAFAGKALPDRARLAATPVEVAYVLPNYAGPPELLIDARSAHYEISSLRKPLGVVAYRSGADNPWSEEEYDRMLEAANDFELRCQGSYPDVAATRSAFVRLDRLYRRVSRNDFTTEGDSVYRRLERDMTRLEQFYSAL